MTDVEAGPVGCSVAGEWVTIERSMSAKPEGVIATVDVSSAAAGPVGIRVREGFPDSWTVTEVGVHPDHEPPVFDATLAGVEFVDVVYPDERRRFVYGIRVESAGTLEPLPEPIIVSERRLPDGDGDSAGTRRPDWPTDADPSGPAEEARDRRDEEPETPDTATEHGDDPGAAADGDDDWTDLEDEPVILDEPVLFDASDADATDTPSDLDPDPAGDGPGSHESGGPESHESDLSGSPESGLPDQSADPAAASVDASEPGEAATGDPADLDGVRPAADGQDAVVGIAGDGGLVEAPPEAFAAAESLLVLADHGATEAACTDLLGYRLEADDHLLLITFAESADDHLRAVRELDVQPASVELVALGDHQRSDAADQASSQLSVDGVSVTSIADPTDLFRLGVHVSRTIDEAPGETHLCLHSLTSLIGLVELQRVFKFLHVLSGRLRAADARAHFHLDPAVVDEQTYRTLEHLFDRVVRFEDGGWMADSSGRSGDDGPETGE